MYSVAQEKSFLNWMRQTNQIYTGNEYQVRLGVYLSNQRLVRQHNAADKGFTVSMNKFAAMTPSEYRSMLTLKPHPVATKTINTKPGNDEVDWRKKGCVNPVKDQGQCGSCWAFSCVQAVESEYAAKYGTLYSLSEQELVDCVSVASGCNGGFPPDVWDWMVSNHRGFMKESDYPYTGYAGTCKYDESKVVVYINGSGVCQEGSEQDLASKVASIGPVSIGIDASNWSFQMYTGGIYDEPKCSSVSLDHGVGCVGYGEESGKKYWIVRNSWGQDWGESGYIRMIKDKNNQCGVATTASYATFK